MLQGDYDSRRVKVLQFSMNPFSVARQQLATECERLQAENARLTKRLRILEEAGGRVDDLTTKVDEQLTQPSTSKEVEGFISSSDRYGFNVLLRCLFVDENTITWSRPIAKLFFGPQYDDSYTHPGTHRK
jgi:cytochrome c-type biogenesis protein CcmH/NrfF